MKFIYCLFLLLPVGVYAQTAQSVTYNTGLNSPSLVTKPLLLARLPKGNVTLAYKLTAGQFFLELSAINWAAGTIFEKDSLVLTLANNARITAISVTTQSLLESPDPTRLAYKHVYAIPKNGITSLAQFPILSVRRYLFNDYADLSVTSANAGPLKEEASDLMAALARAGRKEEPMVKSKPDKKQEEPIREKIAVQTINEKQDATTGFESSALQLIKLAQVRQSIGNRVELREKVFITRFYESGQSAATILDFQSSRTGPAARAIIWEQDKQRLFGNFPKAFFTGRKVALNGLLYLYQGLPYIQIDSQSQLQVLSPVTVNDAQFLVNTTIALTGIVEKVFVSASQGKIVLTVTAATSKTSVDVIIKAIGNLDGKKEKERFQGKTILAKGKMLRNNKELEMYVSDLSAVSIGEPSY